MNSNTITPFPFDTKVENGLTGEIEDLATMDAEALDGWINHLEATGDEAALLAALAVRHDGNPLIRTGEYILSRAEADEAETHRVFREARREAIQWGDPVTVAYWDESSDPGNTGWIVRTFAPEFDEDDVVVGVEILDEAV